MTDAQEALNPRIMGALRECLCGDGEAMGGIGSGRIGARATIEERISLHILAVRPTILAVQATGYPVEGRHTYSGSAHMTLCCRFRISLSCADELILTLHAEGTDWFANQSLELATTPQPRGGYRWWFCCPTCRRRAATLFINQRLWCCRLCAGLTYRSCCVSDKRLNPIIRRLEQDWRRWADEDTDHTLPHPLGPGPSLDQAATILSSTRDLRLYLKGQRLALERLTKGRALYRAEASTA